ncbi:ribonuclease III domain-containing protein [Mycena capillaripes]|nr:ribonuclease III domain-containing protein [Mycena capillaripes]
MALKRAHPSQQQQFVIPDLPKLSADTLLTAFTHKSLRRPDQEPFDNERLSLLGERFLQMLVTEALLGVRPMLSTPEVTTQKNHFYSSNNITLVVRQYGLLNHLRCHPDQLSTLNTLEEAASILHAYIGGIYVDHGDDEPLRKVVQTWIHVFLSSSPAPRPVKKIKMEADSDLDSLPNQSLIPLTTAQPSNQTAPQHATIVYTGILSDRQWVMQCVVNGVVRGTGSDSSKKIAKELAAKQAGV